MIFKVNGFQENDEIDVQKLCFKNKAKTEFKDVEAQLSDGYIEGPTFDQICGICLNDKSNKQWVCLKCAHWFHKECIDSHFKNKKICPICNKSC